MLGLLGIGGIAAAAFFFPPMITGQASGEASNNYGCGSSPDDTQATEAETSKALTAATDTDDFTATTPDPGASGEIFMPEAAFLSNFYEPVTPHQDYDLIWRLRLRGFAGAGTRPEADGRGRIYLLKTGVYESSKHSYIRYSARGDFEMSVEYAEGTQKERAKDFGVAPDGTVAVLTDGMTDTKVHVFSASGQLIHQWNAPEKHIDRIAAGKDGVFIPVKHGTTGNVNL